MNHTLQFGKITSCLMDFDSIILSQVTSGDQLFIKKICSFDKCFSLFIKNRDSGILGEAFLFPFAQCTVILIDGSLLTLSEFLVLADLILLVFVFSFNTLILHNDGLHFLIELSDFSFFVFNFNSNSSNLLSNFLSFVGSFIVLLFHDIKLIVKTGNNILLTMNLSFEVTLERYKAGIISLLSSFKILNLSLESNKVSLI
jgi:hypothetical protein